MIFAIEHIAKKYSLLSAGACPGGGPKGPEPPPRN